MKTARAAPLAVLLLLATELTVMVAAAPAVLIISPAGGSVLLSGTVEINGTASGSSTDWLQTSADDFSGGSSQNLSLDPAGTLLLARPIYDDFNDNGLDTGRWQKTESNGLSVDETGGELAMGGVGAAASSWTSYCQVLTIDTVSERADGLLAQFSETGTGAFTGIGLYQDDSNYILVGRGYDPFGMGPGQRIIVAYSAAGSFTLKSLGNINAKAHSFNVSFVSGTASLYMDGTLEGTQSISLASPRGILRTAVNTTQDAVDAWWDDVGFYYNNAGAYDSDVYDTLTDRPVLQTVRGTADVPAGTTLSVRLRSSGDQGMSGATDWAGLSNGQSSGLPDMQRYIQYEADLVSPQGTGSPQFRDITVRYICGVEMVEVSLDNRTTWRKASGAENWDITAELPDGPDYIWARVTDVEGGVQMVSERIDIDTTPPSGSISIDDGQAITSSRNVSLELPASDAYGVKHMMVSEDPAFNGTDWRDYSGKLDWVLSAGDGPKTIYAKFMDSNGRASGTVSASILLDTEPPTAAIAINDGAAFTRTTSVKLSLNATDASGVADMMISGSDDFSGVDWQPYVPVCAWDLSLGDGLHHVAARFRDMAGLQSATVLASITLDTSAPSFNFTVDNGSAYARSSNVTIRLDAVDNYQVAEMMVSPNPSFLGAAWEPYTPESGWTLPGDQGPVRLSAKVRDEVGNEAPARTASITLDSVAPVCVVSSLPTTVQTADITVSWNGADATSGIEWYDVQSRDDDGPWTDWQVRVDATSAVFTGEDNHTYSFRARAQDIAGNLAAYPDNPKMTTTVHLSAPGPQLPVITILTQPSGAAYKGRFEIQGTARALAAGRTVTAVQYRLDNGTWQPASGTTNWTVEWDSANISNGRHILQFRAYDGQNYSDMVDRTFTVKNGSGGNGGGGSGIPLVLIVAIVAIAAGSAGALAVLRRGRQAPAPSEKRVSMPDKAPEPIQEAYPPIPPAAQTPSDAPPQMGTSTATETAPAGPGASAAVAAPAPSGEVDARGSQTAAVTEASPTHVPAEDYPVYSRTESPAPPPPPALFSPEDHTAILETVNGVFPMLPPELRFLSPDDLTTMVLTAESGRTPKGEPLVLIMGRWYFVDRERPNFLQRFNW